MLMEAKGFTTLTAFEAATGVKIGTASAIINGRSQPGNKVIALLRLAFPGFNGDWLRDGQGEMFERNLAPAATAAPPPQMSINLDVEDMTDAQRADFYKFYYERTKQKLAVAEQTIAQMAEAQEHAEVVQLVARSGGRSFLSASPDAADDDYTPPAMVAETNHEYVAAEEATRRVGFKYGVSLS